MQNAKSLSLKYGIIYDVEKEYNGPAGFAQIKFFGFLWSHPGATAMTI